MDCRVCQKYGYGELVTHLEYESIYIIAYRNFKHRFGYLHPFTGYTLASN